MEPERYQRFTQQLQDSLAQKDHVLGLVALGSMAAQDYLPDEWSDHDFFVIVDPGHQEVFRMDSSWLPNPQEIVLTFRETVHGVKVLYRDAHLLEFAVFDLNELSLARVNRYKILLNLCDLEPYMKRIQAETLEKAGPVNPEWVFGQFLTNLLVGVGRFRRGEHLSAHSFVTQHALQHLVLLCHHCLESPHKRLLDNLDPFRRLEFAFPEAGAKLNHLVQKQTPEAAEGLLEFAEENLRSCIPNYPSAAVRAVSKFLSGDM